MGRRRGRTGAGGAVVSSLSENSGGTVKTKKKGGGGGAGLSSRQQLTTDDVEIEFLADPSRGKGRRQNGGQAGSSSVAGASSSLSLPGSAPKWLGKSPQQMLREWCIRNNRKRPLYVGQRSFFCGS